MLLFLKQYLIIRTYDNNGFKYSKISDLENLNQILFYPKYELYGLSEDDIINYSELFEKFQIPILIDYPLERRTSTFFYFVF